MADWERAEFGGVREDAEGRGVKRWCLKCGGSATGALYDTTCAHEMAPPEPWGLERDRLPGRAAEEGYSAHGPGPTGDDRPFWGDAHPTREGAVAAWQAEWVERYDAAQERAAAVARCVALRGKPSPCCGSPLWQREMLLMCECGTYHAPHSVEAFKGRPAQERATDEVRRASRGPDCADEVDRVLDRDERLRREPEPAPNACELGIGDADSDRLGAVRCCGKPCSIDMLGRTVCIVCRSQVLTLAPETWRRVGAAS